VIRNYRFQNNHVQRWQPQILSSLIIVNSPSSLHTPPIDVATVLLDICHLWTSVANFSRAIFIHTSFLLHSASIMDPANERQQFEPEEARFLSFPSLPDDAKDADGKPRLNKYSATITRGHDFPGAQVRRNGNIYLFPYTYVNSGNAIRRWCSGQSDNAHSSSCWNCVRLVGRQPMQVGYHSYLQ
jgi:hypothetical protein